LDTDAVADRYATVRKVDGGVVCERCLVAETPWLRTKGLLGRSDLPADEGILLRPASSIHMFFMRFPIDAVFLDRELTVLKVAADLAPWRMAAARGAKAVLELPAGAGERCGVSAGDRLVLETSP
jgi:uncharacterized membrane protein (UPF0127 family)